MARLPALITTNMQDALILFGLFLLGAAFGSFACCQAWRIKKNDRSKRSHCMHCKYQLKWYDNVPIVSWLMLGGKCRKCHKKIGYIEILAELGLAIVYILSFLFWPAKNGLLALQLIEWVKFIIFLLILVVFAILFVFDARWKELPVGLLATSTCMALVYWGIIVYQSYNLYGGYDWWKFVLALLFLPGLYYLLYKVSNEKWVGGGDWILCLPLVLLLGGNMWLSLICVFLSNIIGCLTMLPVMAKKKAGQKHVMIPFGPFLIIGFLVTFFAEGWIMTTLIRL